MPYAPNTPCSKSGCRALALPDSPYCAVHADTVRANKRAHERYRGNSAARGYGRTWRKFRANILDQTPLCAECSRQGRITVATVVDHVKPHKGNEQLFWDATNCQPLCKACHDIKTASEDGGFGNARVEGRG